MKLAFSTGLPVRSLSQFKMFGVAGLFITALLASVSSASIETRQSLARVISACTTPNTVALTFVSLFFFVARLKANGLRMMDHGYTSKEIYCFYRLLLHSYGQWSSQQLVDTLDAAGAIGTFFFSMFRIPAYSIMMADSSCRREQL